MKNQKNNMPPRDIIRRKALSHWESEDTSILNEHKTHNKKSWKYSKESKYGDDMEE